MPGFFVSSDRSMPGTGAGVFAARTSAQVNRSHDDSRACFDGGLCQDLDLVAERGIILAEALIFLHRLVKAVLSLVIADVNFRPWRGEKDAVVVPKLGPQTVEPGRFAHMAQGRGRVDQAAVKDGHAARRLLRVEIVVTGKGHRFMQECAKVAPGQRRAATGQLPLNDAAAGLIDAGKTALVQRLQERGFAAARTAGKDNEIANDKGPFGRL